MAQTNGHTDGTANGHHQSQRITSGRRLRDLLENKRDIIVAPGVYDGFSARIALEVGFDCIYMVSIFLKQDLLICPC